jgi:hypothetical protein
MADSLQEDVAELRSRLAEGRVQRAYSALLAFMLRLRNHFTTLHGERAVSALYQGSMDMSFFAIHPPALKEHGLKVAVVFDYDAFRFAVWLVARNRTIQRRYRERFRDPAFGAGRTVPPGTPGDAIIECDVAAELDLGDEAGMTAAVGRGGGARGAAVESRLAAEGGA